MKLKLFQREDLARSALHDGLILGLDTGLGKSLCAYAWPLLKVGKRPGLPLCPAEPVLIIASGDLHAQLIEEGRKHFGITPTVLESQDQFLKLSSVSPNGRRTLPPGFYLSTYTAISRNGVTPFPELDQHDPNRMLKVLNLSERDVEEFFNERAGRYQKHYLRLGATHQDTEAQLKSKWFKARKLGNQYWQDELDESYYIVKDFAAPKWRDQILFPFEDLSAEQQTAVTARFVKIAHKSMSDNSGESRYNQKLDREIKCCYSPTLADLCSETFSCVVADEGVKLKGEDTLVGRGVRQMNPKYRLILTATPIKNRLPDVFRLAWWAVGAHHLAHPRFPFGDDDAETFSDEFMVTERNLSKEERSEDGKRFVKKTPQVCNIHRAWKLFAPIILRRRNTDCGEEMVKMTRHVVRVPMGKAQAEVYRFHLAAKYKDRNLRPAIGAQLQALRVAAANPTSHLLERPAGDHTIGSPRSNLPYIPKLASCLSLVHQILEKKEQVIIFSAFHDSLDALSARLSEAGVKHCVLDGRMSPSNRGAVARLFKEGPAGARPLDPRMPIADRDRIPVMLAGVECMSEGHSFSRCSTVALIAYSWAFDKFLQAIRRILRLDSVKDVDLWAFLCEGSIDKKLEANIQEKGDAAELVLDGQLLGEDPCEVNLAELLQIAQKDFANMKESGTLDERELEKEWPAMRSQLSGAMKGWAMPKNVIQLPVPASLPKPVSPPAETVKAAPAAGWWDDLPLWRQAV